MHRYRPLGALPEVALRWHNGDDERIADDERARAEACNVGGCGVRDIQDPIEGDMTGADNACRSEIGACENGSCNMPAGAMVCGDRAALEADLDGERWLRLENRAEFE